MKEYSKEKSLAIVLGVYVLATAAGAAAYLIPAGDWWLRLLIADTLATVVTFVFSCIFKNASVYDPYWSVQPVIIAAGYAGALGSGGAGVAVILVLTLWSVRLTGNWVYVFRGLSSYEDWRYVMLRERTGVFYPAVNFLGIHMVPTLVVYACTLPAVVMIREGSALNLGTVLFLILAIGSISLELGADTAMHRFKKNGAGGFIRDGLWKYARHPNYLGEISLWWFIALAAVCAVGFRWYLIIGAAANTLLFAAVSIPMAEEHQAKKSGFEEYRRETRLLFPIKK